MATLLVAEHTNTALKNATNKALTAARALGGEVHVLVAGKDCRPAVEAAAKLDGVAKVLLADDALYEHMVAEPVAALIVSLAGGYDAILAPATTTGKNIMPRVAALLDVIQLSDIIKVIAPDTFDRLIYAGSAVQTVRSRDAKKVITVRTSTFQATGEGGATASIEPVAPAADPDLSRFVGDELSKSERPELTSARIIISGGRALQSRENFEKYIEPIADKLGAAVGASRAAVDAGYAPNDYAWGFPYVATTLGVKQVYPGRYIPDALVELIDHEKVTISHCVPTILQMMLASARNKGVALSGWTVLIGGSALPQALARQAMELGIDVFGGYGMSETCPVLTIARLKAHAEAWDIDRQLEVRCKAGRPIPMVQIRIVDEAMNEVPHDNASQGEVVVRAPWLTQGYLKETQSSEKLWAGGWLHTGDIGVIDGEGYLRITDRVKDVIKTGGEWISSLDLEELIRKHPGVADAAVIGVPDPKWT